MCYLSAISLILYVSTLTSTLAHSIDEKPASNQGESPHNNQIMESYTFRYTNHHIKESTFSHYKKKLNELNVDLKGQLNTEEISAYLCKTLPQHFKSVTENLATVNVELDNIMTSKKKEKDRFQYRELKDQINSFIQPKINDLQQEQENILINLHNLEGQEKEKIAEKAKTILQRSAHNSLQLVQNTRHYKNMVKDKKLLKKTQKLHKKETNKNTEINETLDLNDEWAEKMAKNSDAVEYFFDSTLPTGRNLIISTSEETIKKIDDRIELEKEKQDTENFTELKNKISALTKTILTTTKKESLVKRIKKISESTNIDAKQKVRDVNKIIDDAEQEIASQKVRLKWYKDYMSLTSKPDPEKKSYQSSASNPKKVSLTSMFLTFFTREKTPKTFHDSLSNLFRLSASLLSYKNKQPHQACLASYNHP